LPDSLIASQEGRLRADFGLRAVTASEIEFYLHGADDADVPAFWRVVQQRCREEGIALFNQGKERGREQYELALAPGDPVTTAAHTQEVKNIVTQTAAVGGMKADFAARPIADEPGSGLHLHAHLEDDSGNVFHKSDDFISDALKFSIGGLLQWIPDCMPVFAPHPQSYARFVKGETPTTVSWGANNRTVAVRLPDAPHRSKRIEVRMAGADADPAKVIAVVLAAMHDGLAHRIDPGKQIYGDAALAMYGLPKFPTDPAQAREIFLNSPKIAGYFGNTLY
jgi:glutamine synthetase